MRLVAIPAREAPLYVGGMRKVLIGSGVVPSLLPHKTSVAEMFARDLLLAASTFFSSSSQRPRFQVLRYPDTALLAV